MSTVVKPGVGKNAPVNRSRVVAATIVGTAVEWYDYFVYASAAALVFPTLFFKQAGPTMATILSFLTVGISFLFRPLGAFIAGHLGDQIGRRPMLVFTLIMMGVSTTLIGVLPTYAQISIGAPLLLMLLRIVQGLSAGGEWGGAALMAVEHAPSNKRGLFGAAPQIGVPLGLLLSSAMMAIMNILFPGDLFLQWGWRIPFLFSVVLIIVGYWIRRSVDESPVFQEISERHQKTKMPAFKLFRYFAPLVLLSALVFAGNNASGYMTTGGYIQNYATTRIGLDRGVVLWAATIAGLSWLIWTLVAGIVSDKIGRRNTFIIGWIMQVATLLTLFPLVNTKTVWGLILGLVLLTMALGFTYGPLPSWYTELFPASVRFSGVSISYGLGSILGGAFSPVVAAALLSATGTSWSITIYLVGVVIIGFLATMLLRDRRGIPLSPTAEDLQRTGMYIWQKPTVIPPEAETSVKQTDKVETTK